MQNRRCAGSEAGRRGGTTSLFIASRNGHADVAELLIANGARVDAVMQDGATPLFLASENGHKNIVRLLLDAGATWPHLCTSNEEDPPGCLRDPISSDCIDTEQGPVFINAHDPEGRACYARSYPQMEDPSELSTSRKARPVCCNSARGARNASCTTCREAKSTLRVTKHK